MNIHRQPLPQTTPPGPTGCQVGTPPTHSIQDSVGRAPEWRAQGGGKWCHLEKNGIFPGLVRVGSFPGRENACRVLKGDDGLCRDPRVSDGDAVPSCVGGAGGSDLTGGESWKDGPRGMPAGEAGDEERGGDQWVLGVRAAVRWNWQDPLWDTSVGCRSHRTCAIISGSLSHLLPQREERASKKTYAWKGSPSKQRGELRSSDLSLSILISVGNRWLC